MYAVNHNIAFGRSLSCSSNISFLSFGMLILYIGLIGLSNAKNKLTVIGLVYSCDVLYFIADVCFIRIKQDALI